MSSTPQPPYIPHTCTPPSNDPGGTIYFDWPGGYSDHGVYVPPGWYIFDPSQFDGITSVRDVVSASSDPAYQPPLPPWVPPLCDPNPDGTCFYSGGYMPSGKYMGEGWYMPSEFYG